MHLFQPGPNSMVCWCSASGKFSWEALNVGRLKFVKVLDGWTSRCSPTPLSNFTRVLRNTMFGSAESQTFTTQCIRGGQSQQIMVQDPSRAVFFLPTQDGIFTSYFPTPLEKDPRVQIETFPWPVILGIRHQSRLLDDKNSWRAKVIKTFAKWVLSFPLLLEQSTHPGFVLSMALPSLVVLSWLSHVTSSLPVTHFF